ncbi:MAG: aminotransferase class III-fold pyridoxal phosphate-dependent enzyme [Chthonomonadales bacterium]|nr:aminotransferase class III-fold pyridoxal phosphate-dependent enzyme [Chthonomonadales bacterium]
MGSLACRSSEEMLGELGRYVRASPFPFAIDLAASEGMWLATVEGRRLFDWAGYYGSKLIGHNHPRLYEPDYVRRLALAANNKVANPDFLTAECLEYYRLVHSLAPACMCNPDLEVYVVNSGAEAVENMMKYFMNLHRQRSGGAPGSGAGRRFIYFDRAFHGRTVFALNVTELPHDPVVTRDFHGFDQGNLPVAFPAIDTDASPEAGRAEAARALAEVRRLLAAHLDEVAGIVVEPLQGAGGHRLAAPEFYRGLSALAHEYGVFLGFDEVQTAGGQTGTFFAIDQLDLPYPPQAVAAAKKLACGVVFMLHPMEDRGVLDSTWGGTLADMVRFVQEMRVVREERLIDQVPARAARLVAALRRLAARHRSVLGNVRGMGLYQGFSLRSPDLKRRLVADALEREDLLLLGAGPDTVRLRPCLGVTDAEIDLFEARLERSVARTAAASA